MILIAPHVPPLFDRLEGRGIIVRVDDPSEIAVAAAAVRRRNRLDGVIATLPGPLSEFALSDDWRGIPLILKAPAAGSIGTLVKSAIPLKNTGVRVFLPATDLTEVAVDFGATPDWERLADVMTYAVIGLVPHAPIEPFATIAAGFRPADRSDDWGRAEFDDPSRYLHLDAAGRIALTPRALAAGDFAGNLEDLDSVDLAHAIAQHREAWRDLFAADHFCSRCRAFRVCRGRLRHGKRAPDGCDDFFDEMTDVLMRRQRPAA
jgi:hypothetical protein